MIRCMISAIIPILEYSILINTFSSGFSTRFMWTVQLNYITSTCLRLQKNGINWHKSGEILKPPASVVNTPPRVEESRYPHGENQVDRSQDLSHYGLGGIINRGCELGMNKGGDISPGTIVGDTEIHDPKSGGLKDLNRSSVSDLHPQYVGQGVIFLPGVGHTTRISSTSPWTTTPTTRIW